MYGSYGSVALQEHYKAVLDTVCAKPFVPAHARILVHLGYLLHATDEALSILRSENAPEYADIEPQIQSVFDAVDELLKKLGD